MLIDHGKESLGDSAEVASLLLAQGLMQAHERASREGTVLCQDAGIPKLLRRASALLSRLCIEGAVVDLGACVHTMSDRACLPMAEWGVPAFAPPFRFSDAVLIERDTGVPTEDCREMAVLAGGSGELTVQEFLHHDRLRMAVAGRPARDRNAAYEAIRSFVVRNPAVRSADLIEFVANGNHAAALQVVQSFYRVVPQTARFGSSARRCGHCGSLLWPDRDIESFPVGRCRIRQCREANPTPLGGEEILDPSAWRIATAAVMAYWVGPGLDEVRLYDELKAAGRSVSLYPQQDAADVGLNGFEVGIDVKAYSSPIVLGARLTRDTGRLGLFKRKIVAVPDDKLRSNREYLSHLRSAYRGPVAVEFMTVGQTIRLFSQ